MAATVETKLDYTISLSAIDDDYDLGVRARIYGFIFNAIDAGDQVIVRDGSATGPIIWQCKPGAASSEQCIFGEPGHICRPYLDSSAEGTYNAAATLAILLAAKGS